MLEIVFWGQQVDLGHTPPLKTSTSFFFKKLLIWNLSILNLVVEWNHSAVHRMNKTSKNGFYNRTNTQFMLAYTTPLLRSECTSGHRGHKWFPVPSDYSWRGAKTPSWSGHMSHVIFCSVTCSPRETDHVKHQRQVSIANCQSELCVEILKKQWDLRVEEERCRYKKNRWTTNCNLNLKPPNVKSPENGRLQNSSAIKGRKCWSENGSASCFKPKWIRSLISKML